MTARGSKGGTVRPRALLVHGGWKGHTPFESVSLFGRLLERDGFVVQTTGDVEVYASLDSMRDLSLVVQCVTQSVLPKRCEAGLLAAVAGGVGFAGWHGGIIDSYRASVQYQWMVGGQWVAHPGDLIDFNVSISDPEHVITSGFERIRLTHTEQYGVHVDPSIHVLCRTRMSDKGPAGLYRVGLPMPAAWTKAWGLGRVFVACWGHTVRDFDTAPAREIVHRGLLWAARTAPSRWEAET